MKIIKMKHISEVYNQMALKNVVNYEEIQIKYKFRCVYPAFLSYLNRDLSIRKLDKIYSMDSHGIRFFSGG